MQQCPMCQNSMRINYYKDYVCQCQGPLLCYPSLKQMADKGNSSVVNEEITIIVTGGANTVDRCNVLYRQGAKWNPQRGVFFITWQSKKHAEDFISFLEKHEYKYHLKSLAC